MQVSQVSTARIPYSITDRAISVLLDSHMKVVERSSANFLKLQSALRLPVHDLSLIRDLADINSFIERVTFGAIKISDNEVRWNGEPVANVVADRLIDMLHAGHDIEPMARFLDRLLSNPLKSVEQELYLWLESGNAPITPDGYFLAFKKVRHDYKDCHTGTIDNSVGQKPSMPRETVDDNRNNHCSRGLHFCSFGYLAQFGGDRVMIVKIDPANVVSIPTDYNFQKGRCWTYDVVGEIAQEQAATHFAGRPVVADYSNDEDRHATVTNGMSGDSDHSDDVACQAEIDRADGVVSEATRADDEVIETTKTVVKTKTTTKKSLSFNYKGRIFTKAQVTRGVKDLGQRGYSASTSIPRTTLQNWLKLIAG